MDHKSKILPETSAGFYFLAALMIILLPLSFVLSAAIAAMIHEFFHGAAIYLMRGKILHIQVSARGISMDVCPMHPMKELICAMAGPLGSILTATLIHICPMIALCALVQGIFNLIPVYPLDGGRVVRCILDMLCLPDKAEKYSKWIGIFMTLLLCASGLWVSIRFHLGILPAIFPPLLLSRLGQSRMVHFSDR